MLWARDAGRPQLLVSWLQTCRVSPVRGWQSLFLEEYSRCRRPSSQLADSTLATGGMWSRSYLLHLQVLMRSLKLTRGFKLQNGKLHQVEGVIKTMVSTGPCTELSSHHPPLLTPQDCLVPPTVPPGWQLLASWSLEQPSASQVGHRPVKELHGNFKAQETGLRRGWKEEKSQQECDYSAVDPFTTQCDYTTPSVVLGWPCQDQNPFLILLPPQVMESSCAFSSLIGKEMHVPQLATSDGQARKLKVLALENHKGNSSDRFRKGDK